MQNQIEKDEAVEKLIVIELRKSMEGGEKEKKRILEKEKTEKKKSLFITELFVESEI